MKPFNSRPQLVLAVPTLKDAEEQLAMARDMNEEEPTTETYAAVCRATMVLNTKKIELSPEQLAELKKKHTA